MTTIAIENNASFDYIVGVHHFAVSRWVIPRGADYHMAFPTVLFFKNQTDAAAYHSKYEMPPEIADLMPIEKWLEMKARATTIKSTPKTQR